MDSIRYKYFKYVFRDGYYRRTVSKGCKHALLHRHVWTVHKGEIPSGYEIHHIDENPRNNDIGNLVSLISADHNEIHRGNRDLSSFYSGRDKWVKSDACKEFNRHHALKLREEGKIKDPSEKCIAASAEWHASEEGLRWHKEHGKKTWENREWVEIKCVFCGGSFSTPYPSRAKFCSRNCKYRNSKAM